MTDHDKDDYQLLQEQLLLLGGYLSLNIQRCSVISLMKHLEQFMSSGLFGTTIEAAQFLYFLLTSEVSEDTV